MDRRKSKPTNGKRDEMTFFKPPDDCNEIPRDAVPEFGFQLLKSCVLPKVDKNISADEHLCGQLLTFSFQVDQADEIKCYIIWNGQTMRFEGDHIGKILPTIFVDSDENKKFVQSQSRKKMEEIFAQNIKDIRFNRFYKNTGKMQSMI